MSMLWYRARRVLRAAAVLALIAAIAWIAGNRVDPAEVPQSVYFRAGTESESQRFTGLPKPREVVVDAPDRSAFLILASMLPPPVGEGARPTQMGVFDPKTGTIQVTSELSQLEATMPKWLRPTFPKTLRHEYGHAFYWDWMNERGKNPADEVYLAFTEEGSSIDPTAYPEEIRPVVEEYARAPRDVYGSDYFTDTFDEYIAESYARFLSGREVPGATRTFLESCCERK